jgi:hypothetical protein
LRSCAATCSALRVAALSSARPRSPWSVIASSPAPLTSSAKSSSSTTQSCARRMPSPAPSSAASAAWRWTSSPIRTARAPSRARATRANAGRHGRPCPRRLACPKGHAVCAQPGRSAAFPWRRTLARDVRILARGTHTLILVALVAASDWAEPEGHVGTSTVRSSPWQAGAHRRARKLGCAGMHPVSGQGRRPP